MSNKAISKKNVFKNIICGCIVLSVVFTANNFSYAAVGCTLNDPDRDIRRIFKGSTGYRTEFITIEEKGGEVLFDEIEEKLGDTLEPPYELIDVPYAYYAVLDGKDKVGYVHGVNQKGTYGGLQLILATDLDGTIIDFYYQKISSPESKRFRDKDFTGQFIGLSLADFHSEQTIADLKDPSKRSAEDFLATIRGLKKNLILFNEFYMLEGNDEDQR
jgi:hypothetical protein